jgi:uncharacterized protein (DUF1800 family)
VLVSWFAFHGVSLLLDGLLGEGSASILAADLKFRRGDTNGDGKVDLSDAVRTFGFLFLGGVNIGCLDAADANDSGKVDLSDGSYTLNYLFLGGTDLPAPGRLTCGPDPSLDTLSCNIYSAPDCDQSSPPPNPPTALLADGGNGIVNLSWQPSTGVVPAAKYRVFSAPSLNGSYVQIAEVAQTFYTDSPRPNGVEACYSVRAVSLAGIESLDSAKSCATPSVPPPSDLNDIVHVLNRLGYGPSQEAIEHVQAIGIEAYINEQLNPVTIDESTNTELNSRLQGIITKKFRYDETAIVGKGETIRYFKGNTEPPADWKSPSFIDGGWTIGATGIGYGDNDDTTVLTDMQNSYWSVYLRKSFNVPDLAAVHDLIFRVDYDDGFVAYLNGTEVARKGLTGTPPLHTAAAAAHEAGTPEEFNLTSRKDLLVAGTNVLAIQVHNTTLASGDLTMMPELLDREKLSQTPVDAINGIGGLQERDHFLARYSQKQLQAALNVFWDNHLITDFDKVAEYLDGLRNSDATDAMSAAQATSEAAQLEFFESKFFYDNALGNFGDLLLFSATSPTQLIYLDNVLNKKGEANENYAREILELFAFGVDNRYTQKDIEQLAKCFTGWGICKIASEEVQSFPQSAENPPADCGVQFNDTPVISLGAGWKYFKGTQEPSPDPSGNPTTNWAKVGFNDAAAGWANGSTGIGYGDNDDATVLADMQGNYLSVYIRRSFNVTNPLSYKNLIMEVSYDDGFVAYLNGTEVARSASMDNSPAPPPFNDAALGHEVNAGVEYFNLNRYLGLLTPGTNVFAIQVHNTALESSDLSMLPRLLDREILPGSIENGDPNGAWTFYFNPADHDTSAKTLFQGTPYQINVPAGRLGAAGLRDALDVVKSMVNHPSAAEFICIKLIQKFVSDEISLATYKTGTAPLALRELLADCLAAWNSTNPKGNIEKVLEVIFDVHDRQSAFWQDIGYRGKFKTPIEFIDSTLRVLDASANGTNLPQVTEAMGMTVFQRDEPNGYSELGKDWIDTASMLERIDFAQTLAENKTTNYTWNAVQYVNRYGLNTAQKIVDHFADVMFGGTLTAADKSRLVEFLTTNSNYAPLPLNPGSADFQARVQEFMSYMLNLPQWHFQ